MQDRRAIVRRNARDAENSRVNPEADAEEQSAEGQPYDGRVHSLQHALGNAAFARLLTSQAPRGLTRLGVQRHPLGEELPSKDDDVAEIHEKENALPPETRTEKETKEQKESAGAEAKEFAEKQKLTPGAMSLASAEKILQSSYGDFKKIVPGTIEILKDQPACSAKYDEIGVKEKWARPDGSTWKMGDKAKDDAAKGVLVQGFAWKGVVYVNGATPLVTATAHEILHNNTEPKFRNKAGETFNEGVTETLARKALTDAGITVPAVTAYPTQVGLTKKLIDLVGLDAVEKAYFGDVEGLVNAYVNAVLPMPDLFDVNAIVSRGIASEKAWADLVKAAEALDTAKVDEALKPQPKVEAPEPK